MIADALREEVQTLLDQPVADIRSVSGGSINQSAKITSESGERYFLKWNQSAAADMFPKEEKGLRELQSAQSGLVIPQVLGTGSADTGTDFIVMDYLEQGSAGSNSHQLFGKRLAAQHRVTASQHGLGLDNYIGRLPQSNKKHKDWIDFFVQERLEPQLKMAIDDGTLSSSTHQHFQRLYKQLPSLLPDEPASLLHGDLWSGNYFFIAGGDPAIYDPAVYYGNREIELAMTHLFGGFSSTFYDAYNQNFAIEPDFASRKDIYNLYPLLVHTNLFGSSYARRVQSIVKRF